MFLDFVARVSVFCAGGIGLLVLIVMILLCVMCVRLRRVQVCQGFMSDLVKLSGNWVSSH